jgi:hypothetical protein
VNQASSSPASSEYLVTSATLHLKSDVRYSVENPGALFVSSAYAAFDTETYSAAFGGIGVTVLDREYLFSSIFSPNI